MKKERREVHLFTRHKWYDLIDLGRKRVEYRTATPYWKKRLEGATHAVFHRGYSSVTMTFKIKKVERALDTFNIYLGRRVKDA